MTIKTDTKTDTAQPPRSPDLEKKDIFTLDVIDPEAAGVDYSGFTQKTDPKEIKLVRKLDMYIMPSLWAMYWLNYLDASTALPPRYSMANSPQRNAIALAKLSSLTKDLGLSDVQYQTAVSILFAGYVIFGIP